MQKPLENKPPVETLLKMITPETCNVRIYVKEPLSGVSEGDLLTKFKDKKIKEYAIASDEQIRAKEMPHGNDVSPDSLYNHTTTLANIIATNELDYSPQDVTQLVNKLIEMKADFTAVDYTNFQGHSGFVSIQNNPLKSLIALGSCNTDYDQAISRLIDYIGSLPEQTRQKIFSHKDRYVLESMSTIFFLIRQGKEDLALKLVEYGAPMEPRDLIFACKSFGTVPGKEHDQAECIKKMYKSLASKLSQEQRRNCLNDLLVCSDEWGKTLRARGEDIIKKWPDDTSLCKAVLKKARITRDDLSNRSDSLNEKLLQAYIDEMAARETISQWFSGEYRPLDVPLGTQKFTFMQTEEGKTLLNKLNTMIKEGSS